jgi:hypothetical protein
MPATLRCAARPDARRGGSRRRSSRQGRPPDDALHQLGADLAACAARRKGGAAMGAWQEEVEGAVHEEVHPLGLAVAAFPAEAPIKCSCTAFTTSCSHRRSRVQDRPVRSLRGAPIRPSRSRLSYSFLHHTFVDDRPSSRETDRCRRRPPSSASRELSMPQTVAVTVGDFDEVAACAGWSGHSKAGRRLTSFPSSVPLGQA